ncbi:MAG: glycoside hydrolase family 43 protein [Bacteroidetes bacterium]|uniref:Glycoside hydrolase family 43 protein n=1 Tax=Candidatus Cryptobacteroides faecipullorum TaxID=2840764 RepID=A0A9D9I782_9BACT|nr:glycoside hydrolase family 43 protein [Candidatus Cryptobacteroides faecipullorum]
MKKLFFILFLVLAAVPAGAEVGAGTASPVPLADPYILYDGGRYYAYGTYSPDGIVVLVSDDLKSWEWPDSRPGYLALHKDSSYGERWFWAPEVYKKKDGGYLMYYSADEHICFAESDSPLGPFVQKEQKPMLAEKGIDNSLFIDEDGTPYIFWVRFDGGNVVWMAELEDDLKTIKMETMCFCIRMSQLWEQEWPSVNEGPFVMEHKGKYYLTYSANSYESKLYGVGCAVSDSVNGPWTKYGDNPLLCAPDGLVGVGHHAFFHDRKGRLKIVFHSHHDSERIHPRIMHIASAGFRKQKDGADRLVIDGNYFTPVIAE